MNLKIRSTVSVVKISDNILEFFKTNTRQQVRISVEDDTILNVITELNGKIKTIDELSEKYQIDKNDLEKLMLFLESKGILDNVEPKEDFKNYKSYRRVIQFLNDFSENHEHLVNMWNNITNSNVLIIGLGAVGSWVSCNLAQSGVENLILMDNDVVDITNLHRQFGYKENCVGSYKIDAINKKLVEYNDNINVKKIYQILDKDTANLLDDYEIDLVINCAGQPNVDTTSRIIGEYCMKRDIPHIVGGGYNLHLSLIGQTIIPKETACVRCFEKQLQEINKVDKNKVKKLTVKNRKIGSFGPMCSIIASMIGMDCIKILSKSIKPSNINRRGEFNIYTMDMEYNKFEKLEDCECCSTNGKYNNRGCISK
ncbi:ThiF family adenylyltransferase [uncultured Tyzzerella sp.]|uniref:HesA/MoeB/ThiF family protein n=1 Tax=uncultured Tyzzerella sp. TaxID=2321398 RepID=UPI002943591A|nr:ThiF family adenylyltransferase [uncultured Tyzzerella sp.]